MIRAKYGREPDAEDIEQGAIAWTAMYWKGGAKFSTVAMQVAKNRAIDYARKRRRHARAVAELAAAGPGSPWPTRGKPRRVRSADAPALQHFVRSLARELEAILPGAGVEAAAAWVERRVRNFASGKPAQTFRTQLTAIIRATLDTGSGSWLEADDARPVPRRGRPAVTSPQWHVLYERALESVVRRALRLAGVFVADTTAAARKAAHGQHRRMLRVLRPVRLLRFIGGAVVVREFGELA